MSKISLRINKLSRFIKCLAALFLIVVTLISCGPNEQEAIALVKRGENKKAFPMIQQLAENGHAVAQFVLSRYYRDGVEVKRNDSMARIWMHKSAENGYAEAQLEMSVNVKGNDYTESFHWLRLCADQVYPICMDRLARYYENGWGIEKSMDSAMAITTRIAMINSSEEKELHGSNIADARLKLSRYYWNGTTVKKDLIKAYAWFLLYNECKRKLWHDAQKENIQLMYKLENELMDTEKGVARELAEEIMGTPLRDYESRHTTTF
jgi:TPR repeat protein